MTIRAHDDIYLAAVDSIASQYAGCTLRLYTGNVATTKGTAPSGTVLATFTIPTPSHGSAAYNSSTPAYEAAMAGTWQDLTADAAGTIGCFAIFRGATLITDGSAGTTGKDMTTSAATVQAGAAFTVTRFTIRQPAIQ